MGIEFNYKNETPVKTADKIATIIARAIIGIVGLALLWLFLRAHFYSKDLKTFSAVAGFSGLLIGYAFGGDKWGARLFGLFTGHRVRLEKSSKADKGEYKRFTIPNRWFLYALVGLLFFLSVLFIVRTIRLKL
jgi:hypothetical protein